MNPIMKYPVFVAEQVLTAKNLNDIVEYLNEQELSTRRNLIGIGVACGLNVSSDGRSYVKISCGCGVTSLGLLIVIPEEDLVYYKKYIDQATKPYDKFLKDDNTQYDLWELLTRKEYDEADDPGNQHKIDGNSDFNLKDMAVLLYLELIDKDLDNCIDEGCDEKGISRMFNLRRLLIKKTDLLKIITKENDNSGMGKFPGESELFKLLFPACSLPAIMPHRLTFDLSDLTSLNLSEINNWLKLRNSFINVIKDDVIKIGLALYKSYSLYKNELTGLYPGGNPFAGYESVSVDTNQLYQIIKAEFSRNDLNIQYAYDFICDLVKAYQEFTDAAAVYRSKCCIDPLKFPYHLMLGAVTDNGNKSDKIYRHHWQPSPAVGSMDFLLERLRFLHYKIFQMIGNFNLRTFTNPGNIIITPGKFSGWPFSSHSIAHYYSDGKSGKINEFWNYELMKQCKEDTILSYFPELYSSQLFVIHPLLYSLRDYEFFRIEGHIGQEYQSVREKLRQLIEDFNLPIDLIGIKLSSDHLDIVVEDHCFSDIQTSYKCNRDEYLSCINPLYNLLLAYITAIKAITKQYPNILNYPIIQGQALLGFITTYKQLFIVIQFYAFFLGRIRQQLPEHIKDFKYDEFRISYFIVFAFSLICQICMEYLSNLMKEFSAAFLQFMLLKTMFERLIDDCMDSKFKSLYNMYRERLVKLQIGRLFPGYVSGSPGMEHIAGVKEGGTFILVYDIMPDEQPSEPVEPEKPEEEDICFEEEEASQLQLNILQYVYVINEEPVIFEELKDKIEELVIKRPQKNTAKDENRAGRNYTHERVMQLQQKYPTRKAFLEFLFGKATVKPEIKRTYRVVADFAVPFRCCSKCLQVDELPATETEVEFDLEKPKYNRDKYVYCDNDTGKYWFYKTIPAGGVVEGDAGLEEEGGKYFFKPLGLTPGQYTFRYMGEERTVTVAHADPVSFTWQPGTYERRSQTIPVYFTYDQYESGLPVDWSFGDTTEILGSTERVINKIYSVKSQLKFQVRISRISNEGCTSAFSEEIDLSPYIKDSGNLTHLDIEASEYGPYIMAELSMDPRSKRLADYNLSADYRLLRFNAVLRKEINSDTKKRKAFINGSMNNSISREYKSALVETRNAIIKSIEKKDKEMSGYIMELYLGELQQLIATIGAMKTDIEKNRSLFKTLSLSETHLKELKKLSLSINPGKSLSTIISRSSSRLADKKNTLEIITGLSKIK